MQDQKKHEQVKFVLDYYSDLHLRHKMYNSPWCNSQGTKSPSKCLADYYGQAPSDGGCKENKSVHVHPDCTRLPLWLDAIRCCLGSPHLPYHSMVKGGKLSAQHCCC